MPTEDFHLSQLPDRIREGFSVPFDEQTVRWEKELAEFVRKGGLPVPLGKALVALRGPAKDPATEVIVRNLPEAQWDDGYYALCTTPALSEARAACPTLPAPLRERLLGDLIERLAASREAVPLQSFSELSSWANHDADPMPDRLGRALLAEFSQLQEEYETHGDRTTAGHRAIRALNVLEAYSEVDADLMRSVWERVQPWGPRAARRLWQHPALPDDLRRSALNGRWAAQVQSEALRSRYFRTDREVREMLIEHCTSHVMLQNLLEQGEGLDADEAARALESVIGRMIESEQVPNQDLLRLTRYAVDAVEAEGHMYAVRPEVFSPLLAVLEDREHRAAVQTELLPMTNPEAPDPRASTEAKRAHRLALLRRRSR